MAINIYELKDGNGNKIYPSTHSEAVIFKDGENLTQKIENLTNLSEIILVSPNNSKFILSVTDDGILQATPFSEKPVVPPEKPVDPPEGPGVSEIPKPETGYIAKFTSTGDGSATVLSHADGRSGEIYDANKQLVEAVTNITEYTYPENNAEFYFKCDIPNNAQGNNYILLGLSNLIEISYIAVATNSNNSTRYIYDCPNLTKIGEIDAKSSVVIPSISSCSNLRTIETFSNIENAKIINIESCKNLNFVINPDEFWNREMLFTTYSFSNCTSLVENNPNIPKSWGGTASIPITSISFKATAPTDNSTCNWNYYNLVDHIDISPSYHDNPKWVVNSPSKLIKIDNAKTGRCIHDAGWDTFSGTEVVTITCENDATGDISDTLEVTITL